MKQHRSPSLDTDVKRFATKLAELGGYADKAASLISHSLKTIREARSRSDLALALKETTDRLSESQAALDRLSMSLFLAIRQSNLLCTRTLEEMREPATAFKPSS